MNLVKKCLKSWGFWLILSIIILGVGIYYWQSLDNYYWEFVYDYYRWAPYNYYNYDEIFGWIILSLFMISNIMCLINLSRKDGIRRLLTVTICSFAIFLFLTMSYDADIFDFDIFETISMLIFFFVFMPAWTLTLLKLVWRNKGKSEDESKQEKRVEEEKLDEKTVEQ